DGGKPGECSFSRWLMPLRNRGQPLLDDLGIDELGVEQRCHEVLVLLAEGAEFGDAEIFLVQAPSGVLGRPGRRCGVGVLDPDQAVAPAIGKDGGLQSTPSMLKPCCSSNGDHSPATPSIRSARRAVSSLLSASGRMSISTDMVASSGRLSS